MSFRKFLEDNSDDFFQHHYTGQIPSHAYEQYEKDGGLAWLGSKTKYPKLLNTKQYGPYLVEFRQRDTKLQYVKYDDNDDLKILRDEKGMALYLSPEEMKAKGYRETDETIAAFVGDTPIGLASNEFGAVGVWVEAKYQKLGIGSDLLVMYMEDNHSKFIAGKGKIGQMTNAGRNMTYAAYNKLAQKYGPNWFKPKS
jgi:GNAT superfamily N-acetyltransferase